MNPFEFQYPNEIAAVQNPALGAYAIWRFGLAFQSREEAEPTLPLAFLVLPLVLHGPTRELIRKTQKVSGLALFAGKLGECREDLLAVHDRALQLRQLTLESIAIGERAKLFTLDLDQASFRAHPLEAGVQLIDMPDGLKWLSPACERLGYWFAVLTDEQVTRTLYVDF
ncbi:three component ABC system middle component [Pseudoduganella sp. RAF53_2]|uniref:three component ABC system middle component n=1 Tax=unclassified Pseudoduganella TaxID=2637179 RepID=UPI003F9D53AC